MSDGGSLCLEGVSLEGVPEGVSEGVSEVCHGPVLLC
jgi:hypothetical protein